MKKLRFLCFPALLIAFVFCVVQAMRSQVTTFGTPTAIPAGTTGVTSPVQDTNTPAVPIKHFQLFISVTNPASTFTGNVLMSLDKVNFITNGTWTSPPFTNGQTTNVPITISAFTTNTPIYFYFQGLMGPGITNAGWVQAQYGPN